MFPTQVLFTFVYKGAKNKKKIQQIWCWKSRDLLTADQKKSAFCSLKTMSLAFFCLVCWSRCPPGLASPLPLLRRLSSSARKVKLRPIVATRPTPPNPCTGPSTPTRAACPSPMSPYTLRHDCRGFPSPLRGLHLRVLRVGSQPEARRRARVLRRCGRINRFTTPGYRLAKILRRDTPEPDIGLGERGQILGTWRRGKKWILSHHFQRLSCTALEADPQR